jgi:hypothetical protein
LPVSLALKSAISSQVYRFWATGTLTKQICICLQQSCFIAGNEIGINMRRFRPVSAQGCSFITLLSWLTTKFSHQNLFDTFWWEIGAQCVTAGSISRLVWHTCVVAFVQQAEGGNFFSLKEIPVSDRSDTFMTLKKCLCGGEVETFFYSKSCSGSIAQSIKSLFTRPTEGGS